MFLFTYSVRYEDMPSRWFCINRRFKSMEDAETAALEQMNTQGNVIAVSVHRTKNTRHSDPQHPDAKIINS